MVQLGSQKTYNDGVPKERAPQGKSQGRDLD
jgi:hypothetical protein